MDHEAPFLFVLLMVTVFSLVMTLMSYVRAAMPEEPVSWREEGLPMFVSLRLAGLLLVLATFAYVVNPGSMTWASVPIADPIRWAGAVMDLIGVVLLAWTNGALGRNLIGDAWTFGTLGFILTGVAQSQPDDTVTTRHMLVTAGPYRWVRHPYYSTDLVLVVGTVLMTANWFIGVLGLAVFALLILRTPNEEQKLIERFRDEYRAYMEKTGRFVPRFW